MISLRRARMSCAISALLVSLTWGLGYSLFHPSEELGPWLAIAGSLPPLLFAVGVLQGKVLPTALLGFFALFYMAHGFTELMANPEVRGLATALSLFSLALFLTAGHSLRVQSRQPRE
ncbi:DUF2069 domain-containing protein [Gammaproteobacteria bacterium AB-CW1]|uniref:DUF2069 domain-containing protein n=1 Tax=Natronospira elongata TaxID=3110268 RepID=A0AAP6JD57_9GAMM|nr:DUF2069 domain-containing protein [Gammaproteobacteria bacterium AB-CW1]